MKFYVKTRLSENISETPEGFLLCLNVPLSHTGKLHYPAGQHPFTEINEEIIVTRDAEELFSIKTMASFEGKDLTIQHPTDFVTPENYSELTHGVLFNVRKSNEKIEVEGEQVEVLQGDILVKSKRAITDVKNGMRELSLGYHASWEVDENSKIGKHKNIIGNHVALVEEGRAGVDCAIKDSKKENDEMSKLKELNDFIKKKFGKTADEMMKEEKKKKEEEAEDEEESSEQQAKEDEKFAELTAKVSKLEEMFTQLMEKMGANDSSEESEEEKIVADEEESDVVTDEDEEEDKKAVKDSTLSYAEILSPGIQKTKDIKIKALQSAYKTAEGKKAIDTLTGGKGVKSINANAIDSIFIAAAEIVKASRVKDHAASGFSTIDSFPALKNNSVKSADDINKMNKEFYNKK